MPVYKAYFKIIKQNLPSISIYISIFLILAVMFTYLGGQKTVPGFSEARTSIAFISHDQGGVVANGLRDYLAHNAHIVKIEDNKESRQDALFFRKVEYIVTIPAGFSQSFISGRNNVKIAKTAVPNSVSSVQLDFLINRYLNTVALYKQNMPSRNDAQLMGLIQNNLDQHGMVKIETYGQQADNAAGSYYSFLVFAMLAIIFLGVTSTMLVFNDQDIRRRNLGSPLKLSSMNIQLLLGNLSFTFAVWIIVVALGFAILGRVSFDLNTLLLILNSLCLAFVCLSLSFLVGHLIRSKNAQPAVVNVLTLGLCFISGAFVPQQILGRTVNFIASFTPTYWYVKAVNDIQKLVVANTASLTPVVNSMLIQLGFVVALLTIALVVAKQKRASM